VLLPAAGPLRTAAAAATRPRLDVTSQHTVVEPDGQFIVGLDVRDAPPGSTIETTLYNDPVPDRATFNQTLFFNQLGDKPVRIETIRVDDLASAYGDVRQTAIGISLIHDRGSGAGQISLERGLGQAGVYPVDVQLRSREGDVVGRVITYLVRLPKDMEGVKPLRAAMVFDIHAPPSVTPDGTSHIRDADLDRIGSLVEALRTHPGSRVTLVPTPETIEALAREPGRPRELLARLQELLPGNQVVARPYVDVPVSAWIDAGMGDELNLQRDRGYAVLTEHLKQPDRTTWVATPDLTAEAAAQLWEAGVTRFVLPEGSFEAPKNEEPPARPFELDTRVDAPVQAVALDSSISFLLTQNDDPELRAQQVMSALAVTQSEVPTEDRGVVFGPAPGSPLAARVISRVLELLEANPLVRTATVGEVFGDVDPARTGDGGAAVTRRLTPVRGPGLGDYPARLRDVQAHVDSFSQVIRQSGRLLASWQQRLLASGAADLEPAARARYIDTIQATIAGRLAKIDSPGRQTVTLTSREGDIPFSLRNGLGVPVDLLLELDGGSQLEFPDGGDRQRIHVDPGTRPIGLRVRTRSPGVIPVTVRITSPDGGLLVATSRVTVRSTAVSGIGYVLSIGAALFLVVWWFRHWRRVLRERRAATGGEVTGPAVAGS
jgi:hypothetical protein